MEAKVEKINNDSRLFTQASENLFSKSQRVTQKIFKDFCQSTSLHGYSYLYNTNSVALRIAWVFVILIMTYLGITFVVNNTNAYFKSSIVTSIETSSASLSVSTTLKSLKRPLVHKRVKQNLITNCQGINLDIFHDQKFDKKMPNMTKNSLHMKN